MSAAVLWGTPSSADEQRCGGKELVVTALPDGTYLWAGELVTDADLQDRFVELARRTPAPNIVVVIDNKTLFGHYMRLNQAQLIAHYPCRIVRMEKFR